MKTSCLVIIPACLLLAGIAAAQDGSPEHAMPGGGMADMGGHMYMTKARPMRPGDQQAADAVVAKVKPAIEKYKDYHKALADGFQIFMPEIPQHQYHFTNYENAREAWKRFDPTRPTSLLYKKTGNGYQLVGVMYTDRVDAPESELDARIPLSIAHWHQHINFCQAPSNDKAAYMVPNAKFGLHGSIVTAKACEEAGGRFRPHLFGWMVHVYPFEADPKKIWSVDTDDDGHDNMDHAAMPGMKMD